MPTPARPTTRELLETAVEAARIGGRVLAERFGGERTIEFKGGIDLVTDADRAAETALIAFIRDRYPDHGILAEESGAAPGTVGYRWIVDPLDGTTNYSHRVPHFSVSVAVEDGKGLAAGVVFDPLRDELFAAERGQGASLNGKRIHVSATENLGRALVCTGFPYDVREKPDAPVGLFNRIIRQAQGVRRTGSAALDLAYVACGRFDGFFEFGLKPWDLSAGALLVLEAGGRMTRIDGEPLDVSYGDVLACTPGLFDRLRAETSDFLRDVGWKPRRFDPFG